MKMSDGDFADTCDEKFPVMTMGSQAEGLVCEDPVARTPIGVSGNLFPFCIQPNKYKLKFHRK